MATIIISTNDNFEETFKNKYVPITVKNLSKDSVTLHPSEKGKKKKKKSMHP
jgi:hypothetical protein